MGLLGNAAVVIWSEMADPAAHDDWHSHEHLPERLGIPGFLRARRWVASDGGTPRYFVMYEVRDAAVMVSPAYLERLNHPTPWSQRTMAANLALNRTLCLRTASCGRGVGSELLAIDYVPPVDPAALRTHLSNRWLPELAGRPGLTGAHLLQRDAAATRPPTEEERLRRRRDDSIDALLLVEGYDATVLAALAPALLATLREHGVAGEPRARRYALAHLMASDDTATTRP